ncbi:Crp/Fnr family transcriptional regulator [Rhodocytophaga aerolata]|uniref:Crp/Fnr family transcriptional regulator n=1 Tax=Rhodocytophaga aerolata TaxID=455078 RepID=A0ABT8RJU3_9BACT|nr:Crp/Fnr family transcriptional regulator [Rhodocytophaga aerolata]MDO1451558.1 Crp/Fnr family transcriptional regulator [Rhodocytophaga aerolata]
MIDNLVRIIRQTIEVSETECELIAMLFTEKVYKKGSFFLSEGDICKHVGFISRGLVRYYINDEGEDKTYYFSQENEFVCNYESFVPQQPSKQNIQALEDCTMQVISYNDLQTFYKKLKNGDRFGRLVIEQVFIKTLQELNSFYTDPADIRYQKFMAQHPDLQQRIPQYYIASFVGVKPQSLSRIRKKYLLNN